MRGAWAVLVLATGLAGELRAQATEPQVEVTGRTIELRTVRGAPNAVRGELLAVRRDSVWVLADAPRRIVALGIADLQDATVQRHGLTPRVGLLWGLGVGVVSGLGLTAACSSLKNASCGGVFPVFALGGLFYGGVAAISFHFSSRWTFEPVIAEALAPFARFPQGPPPGGLDALARPALDSQVVRPRR